ncbi:MAG: glycosyltransferase [Lachnospiraceae bacterium]
MKIAMMTNNYKPFVGGVPVSVERLACGLRERGHEVCVFAPEYRELENEETGDQRVEEQEDVVRYRSCRRKLENGMVIPDVTDPRIREAFAKIKFDLIHVHQPMLIGNTSKCFRESESGQLWKNVWSRAENGFPGIWHHL